MEIDKFSFSLRLFLSISEHENGNNFEEGKKVKFLIQFWKKLGLFT